ncbi:MAG: tetrahydrodipicolinate N-succinyltransferase N-terminal domain-containing protein [Gammaproteobacteria bacterium]|jgi:2,3,4,5-tetrahydropyridine-2-carboxylate N-succinyltransferase
MDTFPLIATGVASTSLNGEILAIRYTKIVCKNDHKDEYESLDSVYQQMEKDGSDFVKLSKTEGQIVKERQKFIVHKINKDTSIEDVKDAYLKLHLLSMKLVKPNTINLEGIFSALPNVAWTNQGPIHPNDLDELRSEYDSLYVRSLDKFPCLTDYVIPNGVRIADANRVRLGAYLSEGTTIMHEGFVNFNAGTLGPSMIEGRISAGVVVGKNSDLGGGCSTMGTLSGGNNIKISVGEDCLLGANSGLGIPLGDRCIIEAGLYLTGGSKVEILNPDNELIETVKASTLSGQDDLLFIRNSLTGAIQCKPNGKSVILNETLHKND